MSYETQAPVLTRSLRECLRLLAACLVVSGCAGSGPAAVSATPNFEGLVEVRRPQFDLAQVRPGTSFDRYEGLILGPPELAFKTPDRAAREFALDAQQKRGFEQSLATAFEQEFSRLRNFRLVEEPAANVIALKVRVENISAAVPSGRGSQLGFALTATGEATLIVELYDAESGEILARGVDTRLVSGAAARQDGAMITRWEDIEKLARDWALKARTRIDALVE